MWLLSKTKINIFQSIKQIGRIAEILESDKITFIRVVGQIVVKLSEIEFYDVTVGELKKCRKFETALVSSSQ